MPLNADAKKLAQTLIDGMATVFQNADELYDEALHLAGMGATARALLLHQISLEECGKADMLCTSVFVLLRGGKIDMKRLVRTFKNHKAKNEANAYFLPVSAEESAATRNNDIETAHATFKRLQGRFHKKSNELKNAALYVDFDGQFVAPRDVIGGEQLADIRQRNAEFMEITHNKMNLLAEMNANLDSATEELAQMSAALGIDALDRSDPQTLKDFMSSLPEKLAKLSSQRKERSSGGA